MLFFRFMFCLAVGLIGLCMVLMTVLETLFADWDVLAEMKLIAKKPSLLRRAFDPPNREDAAPQALSTRMAPYQGRGKPAVAELEEPSIGA